MCGFSRVLNLISLPDVYFKHTTFPFQSERGKSVNEGSLSPIILQENVKIVLEKVPRVLA